MFIIIYIYLLRVPEHINLALWSLFCVYKILYRIYIIYIIHTTSIHTRLKHKRGIFRSSCEATRTPWNPDISAWLSFIFTITSTKFMQLLNDDIIPHARWSMSMLNHAQAAPARQAQPEFTRLASAFVTPTRFSIPGRTLTNGGICLLSFHRSGHQQKTLNPKHFFMRH